MAHPRILHMITPLKHMSPFDVNMALDAGYDAAIPYTSVTVEDVTGLVQDAIFSRGPEGVKRTAMFIGGKRAIEALVHHNVGQARATSVRAARWDRNATYFGVGIAASMSTRTQLKVELLDTYKNKPPTPTTKKYDVAVLMAIVFKM